MDVDRYEAIYRERAEDYDRLVSAEDRDGALVPALASVARLAGADVLEVGVGTGRITRKLAALGARVIGFDRSEAMLEVARRRLEADGAAGVSLARADAASLPIASGSVDVAIAGWVFGHFCSWVPQGSLAAIGRALDEMERALRPGGASIVIETLGTGEVTPRPPTAELGDYYAWLEAERGYARETLRTDFQFDDVDTAAEVTGFFFGPEFAARVRREGWARVPENTGVWWRRAPGG